MEEFTDAFGAIQGEGGIEGPPGERDGAGGAILGFLARPRMEGAGEFAIEGLSVEPVFRMDGETGRLSGVEEQLCHIFIGDHSSGSS